MKVIDIPVHQIEIGERRRTDLGDIAALAKGMKRVGLLNPIIVDRGHRVHDNVAQKGRFRLVAGERRLKAARTLRWKTIPASLREDLTDAQLREIELEENENRKSLTVQERRRTFGSAKKAKESAAKAREVLNQSDSKPRSGPKGGRPQKAASTRAVAKALGASQMSVVRNEQHVALAERYPWLQSDAWRQADVLRFQKELNRIPEPEQGKLCQFMERAAAPLDPRPDRVIEYAEVMGAKTPVERSEIYRLAESGDERDHTLACTRALHRQPMPDARLAFIREAMPWLQKAVKPPFDQEPETKAFAAIVTHLEALRETIQTRFETLKKQEAGYVEEDIRRRETVSA